MQTDNRQPAILVDPAQQIFKVARRNFTDPEIFKAEKELVFERSWLYLGHASELPKPGDFVSRTVAGRSILSLLHGVDPVDPASYSQATLLLAMVAGVAAPTQPMSSAATTRARSRAGRSSSMRRIRSAPTEAALGPTRTA